MAGRKTKNRRRTLTPQAPPSRPNENIQVGGTKVGMRSGAAKSDTTRAKRRSAAVRWQVTGRINNCAQPVRKPTQQLLQRPLFI